MTTLNTTEKQNPHPILSDHSPHTIFLPDPTQAKAQPQYSILPVLTASDLHAITVLFTQYTQSLNIDLTFQDVQSELSTLPGKYSPSQGGMLLLARNTLTEEAVGCIALRSLPPSPSPFSSPSLHVDSGSKKEEIRIGELKRLYVHPSTRGAGLGQRLTQSMLVEAERVGYQEVKLDTLPTMKEAQRMYEKLGFRDVDSYCFNPIRGTRFLGLKLGRGAEREEREV